MRKKAKKLWIKYNSNKHLYEITADFGIGDYVLR